MLHTCDASRAVRSRSLATGVAARCSAAGERLIAGHRPIVFGRVASDGAKSVCILELLACFSTPWAPRSDLLHRSGRGAFERLRAASPEVATACRVAGHWRRSAAHSRADSELRTTVCVIVYVNHSFFRNPHAPDFRAAYALWGSRMRHSVCSKACSNARRTPS